jgi:hypothetical protein
MMSGGNGTNNYISAVKSFFHLTNNNEVRVEGTSMWPSIRNNQIVKIACAKTQLRPGACYVFLSHNRLVAHRFVTLKDDKAIFLGDRSLSIETIPVDCVFGEVVLRQHAFIRRMISIVNLIFFHFFLSFKKVKMVRMAFIFILSIGGNYAGKV